MRYEIKTFDEEKRKNEWDDLIIGYNGSFLQSWGWGELQKQNGRSIQRLVFLNKNTGKIDFMVSAVKHFLPCKLNYIYVPRGPVAVGGNKLSAEIVNGIKENFASPRTIFLRMEPTNSFLTADDLEKIGFRKSASVQPENTLILDLTKNKEELLKEMEYEKRYNIRTARRRGVKIVRVAAGEQKKYFEDFWSFLAKTASDRRFRIYPREYYQRILEIEDNCLKPVLFAAEWERRTIAAFLIIFYGAAAAALYGASADGFSRLKANSLLLWEAILDAKNSGYKIFDFWGISESDKKWRGFSAFKKTFGGQPVNYLGTWDYVFDKKLYFLYRVSKLFR